MASDMIFSSESVTSGHPDKLCDQISDAAIDALLRADRSARASIECAVATGIVFLAARCAANATIDLASIARGVIAEAGYREDGPFNARTCSILASFSELPMESRDFTTTAFDDGLFERLVAQEQVNAFGYACSDTPELMPMPVSLAHRLARALDDFRRSAPWLSPDCKTQVSVEYQAYRPARVHAVSVNAALGAGASQADARDELNALALAVLGGENAPFDRSTSIYVNPASRDADGPAGHAGLTGRKNGIDTYGEISRQSGAALSGKDPSRIDRIGAYAARHAAKNVVAAGLAERCEVHLAYAIGQARPISVSVETFGTGKIDDDVIGARLAALLDFRPAAIAHRFALRSQPAEAGDAGFFRRLAVYGHFGRQDMQLPWEATELIDALRG